MTKRKQHMNKIKVWTYLFLALVGFSTILFAAKAGAEYLSPLALVADNGSKTLYVAEATAKQVAVFNITSGKVTKVISLPDQPTGLALAQDGSRLYVTGGVSNGWIHVVNLQTGKVARPLSAGHSPVAPVVSPDGKMLYVCNRFNNNVSVINLKSRKEIAKINVQREPVRTARTCGGGHYTGWQVSVCSQPSACGCS
ncbi:MAG: YncE family protein [Planctomycetota bacterium]|jgi:YVTN family beta-propeller protein